MTPTVRMMEAVNVENDVEKIYERLDGQLEAKERASSRHGGVGTRLMIELGSHVKLNKLGAVYGANTTYQIGKNERIPDASFLSKQRIPPAGETMEKWPMAPDLAVEVISPNENWSKVNRKVREYFAAGVTQVWLVSLELCEIHVYDSPKEITVLMSNDELLGAKLLPGFRCRISEIFQQPARA